MVTIMSKRSWIALVSGSLMVSVLSHLFFLYKWGEGSFMTGPNDGLNQMLPFKQFIYENYTSGNLFYSLQFGFGGDFYGQLGYYFSTNLFFIMTIIVVFLLELLHIIEQPDVLFWAQAIVFTSIIRMTLVITLTTLVFKYFSFRSMPAFVGASLYGSSVIYFRHATYWEFFADAFLFIPLLVLGVEKIIREGKPAWFVFVVAATIFNNFYFAYINFIFIGIYILFRWMIPLNENESHKLKQVKLFATSGVLGFGISSIAFIPTIYAYFQNYRPSFNQEIPLFDLSDNILLNSYTFLLSTIVVLFLFMFSFYKNNLFRLFAALTLLLIVFHFSPFMGSAFNGFSAPRNRFEYVAFFTAGGMVAAGLQLLQQTKLLRLLIASLLTCVAYILCGFFDQTYSISTIYDQYMIALPIFMITAFFLLNLRNQKVWITACVLVLLANAGMVNVYQYDKIYKAAGVEDTTKQYITSDGYYSEAQREIVERVKKQDTSPFYRFQWRGADERNNIPLIQDFYGTSVYSSILNQNILFWYYKDLEIDMKHESISRYSGFGDRANVFSLLRGKYFMVKKGDDRNIPYGFEHYMENQEYQVYRNTNILPFVRTTSTVYSEKTLEKVPIVAREQAMLDGVIVKDPEGKTKKPNHLVNLLDQVEVEAVGATYEDGQLKVTEEKGGIDLNISSLPKEAKDLYVSFYLQNNDKDAPLFHLSVNDFETARKSRSSFYRTGMNDITIRVPKDDQISIRVPKGSYTLEELDLYHENYRTLERAAKKSNPPSDVKINGNHIQIEVENSQNARYLTIPVPYEKGWHVEVNGEKKKVQETNYAFLGVKLEQGTNHISFTYYPPYFKVLLAVSILSLVCSILWVLMRKYKS